MWACQWQPTSSKEGPEGRLLDTWRWNRGFETAYDDLACMPWRCSRRVPPQFLAANPLLIDSGAAQVILRLLDLPPPFGVSQIRCVTHPQLVQNRSQKYDNVNVRPFTTFQPGS